MTIRQTFVKLLYPVTSSLGELFAGNKDLRENLENAHPLQSVYDLSFVTVEKANISLQQFKGKKLLLVNTASDCGFTPQLKELQQLQDTYKDSLVVIGFPSNDFKEQDKGSDSEINTFCTVNYGVQFLLSAKSVVTATQQQHSIFKWLTIKNNNGWNNQPPAWNFTKYLINEQGVLTNIFGPATSPLSIRLRSKL